MADADLDVDQIRQAVIAELRKAIGFVRWCWPLTDPDTGLAASGIGSRVLISSGVGNRSLEMPLTLYRRSCMDERPSNAMCGLTVCRRLRHLSHIDVRTDQSSGKNWSSSSLAR